MPINHPTTTLPSPVEIATLGGGCFWCIEPLYQQLKGVVNVESGYAGGQINNPTYREICSGLTGHAEVIQVQFDPRQISYTEILEVFFAVHDPTTLNRQGNDAGPQYRSVIFFHNPAQQMAAEQARTVAQLDWNDPIVTEISPATNYFPAEVYHQNYFNLNPNQPYCSFVIGPKVRKFKAQFKDKLFTNEPR